MPCQWIVVGASRWFTTVISVGSPRVTTIGGPTDLSSEATIFFPSRTEQEKVRDFPPAALGSITRSIFRAAPEEVRAGADGDAFTLITITSPAMSFMLPIASWCACAVPALAASGSRYCSAITRLNTGTRSSLEKWNWKWQWNNQRPTCSGVHSIIIVLLGCRFWVTTGC